MMTTIPLIRGHLKGMVTSMFNEVWSNGETEVDIVQVEERQRSSIMNINLTLHHGPLRVLGHDNHATTMECN